MKPLNIVILWHMHQPYYRDPERGEYTMPWVRLHGIKDYCDMVEILKDFPSIRVNFNLVPSLIKQIEEYARGDARDVYLEVSRKHPSRLSEKERSFILKNFFMSNRETMIDPHPGYRELYQKRGEGKIDPAIFSDQDLLDLQVWFNLAWFDPIHIEKDPFLKGMVEKGRGFTQEEKEGVLQKQIEVIKRIIPVYREMEEKGAIEISTSPFYHPILPLLCDSYSAKETMPDLELDVRFKHPEDARAQLRMGVEYFEKVFGHRPKGCWPPEGGVSMELMPILTEEGFQWTATDEGILSRSIGEDLSRDNNGVCQKSKVLYKVYRIHHHKGDIAILFRDRVISDLIGFVYSRWDPDDAANDLIRRLHLIRERLKAEGADPSHHVVPIILDGENPWEYYERDGRDFLCGLYSRLEEDPYLRTVKVSEFLRERKPEDRIDRLIAGSWVDSNFRIWIGHREDQEAWRQLERARKALDEARGPEEGIKEAWECLYIAEGSDWFWWYGDEHHSLFKAEFDELFRKNLKRVYRLISATPPPSLDLPIYRKKEISIKRPRGFVKPAIDGEVTSYFEWLQAGWVERKDFGGTMHHTKGFISALYFGFDLERFYLRIDHDRDLLSLEKGDAVGINILSPEEHKVTLLKVKDKLKLLIDGREGSGSFAIRRIIEMGIPLKDLGAERGQRLSFFITIERKGRTCERLPREGVITLTVPTEDFESWNWLV